MPQLR